MDVTVNAVTTDLPFGESASACCPKKWTGKGRPDDLSSTRKRRVFTTAQSSLKSWNLDRKGYKSSGYIRLSRERPVATMLAACLSWIAFSRIVGLNTV